MHPILFQFGPITIYSYGFFLALAYLTGSILAQREAKIRGFGAHFISNLCLLSLISGILGARIFFLLFNLDFFKENPLEIIMLQHGGLVWYGGLISAIVSVVIYIRIKKQPIFATLDLVAPYIALAQAIGRIGCFLNGCCYGKLWRDENIPYPTQIFSSLSMLFVFLVLRVMQKQGLKTGSIFFSYLLLYSAKRFFIEFLRGDSPVVFLNLTVFQLASVGIFVSASVTLIFIKNR
ncbi:MAG: prolipoprotein diacylglyceryl transferase [Candidatus Omnitrophota bacterium]